MNLDNLTLTELISLRGRVNERISRLKLNLTPKQSSDRMSCVARGLGWKICKGRVKCVPKLGVDFSSNVSK
jgi:hypothetical protein